MARNIDTEGSGKKKKKKDEESMQSVNLERPGATTTNITPGGMDTRTKRDIQLQENPPSVTFNDQGKSTTVFDKKLPPPEIVEYGKRTGEITVNTEEEIARRAAMNPQERYEEDREAAFKRGDYSMFTEQELADRLRKEGKTVYETTAESLGMQQQQEEQVKQSFLDIIINGPKELKSSMTAADFPVVVPVGGLNPAMAAGAGETQMTLAGTPVKTLAAGAVANSKAGIAKVLGIGGGLFGANKLLNTPKEIITSSKQAMAGTVQTAELINNAVQANVMNVSDAILYYDELERDLAELERNISFWCKGNYHNWLDGGKDNLIDIRNYRLQLQIKRQMLMQAMVKPKSI